jgi:release factor glutamine methyltransferase
LTTSFAEALSPRLDGKVDVLLFNFPYVPTPSEEVRGHGIERSWAGGERGRQVIDQWIQQKWMERLLSKDGVCYVVLLKQNDIPQIIQLLGEKWQSKQVIARKCGNEALSIIRFMRK